MSDRDIARLLADEAERFEREKDQPREGYYRASTPSQVYSVRIPVDKLGELRHLADARREKPSTMMRRWILKQLDQELERERRERTPSKPDNSTAVRACMRGSGGHSRSRKARGSAPSRRTG